MNYKNYILRFIDLLSYDLLFPVALAGSPEKALT